LWGTTYLAIRIALESIPPLSMSAFRWIIAGTLILAVLEARGEALPERHTWPSLAILGILLLGFGNGGVVWAEQTVPSGLTALLVATVPFWMVGIDALRADGERITTRRAVGLLVGFAGIVLLVWPEIRTSGGRGFLSGVVAAQIACIGWAIGSTYARRRRAEENVLAVAAYEMLFGGAFLLILGLLNHEWGRVAFTRRTAGALAYLIVFGSLAGFSAYTYALKHLPVATVSLYAYVNPVIAVMLGTLILNEPFNWRMGIAAAVVLAGVALVRDTTA
jgi:drug/metabolite transporter (DMT)-like permease